MSTATIVAILATALFGGPAITTFLALRAGWRWADLDAHARRRMVQHVFVYGLMLDIPVGVVALIAAAVLDHPAMPIASGVVVVLGLAFWIDRATRGFDAIHRCARALETPETAPGAVDKLLELAAARTPSDPMGRSEILGVAVVLGNAGYDREALPLLESIDPKKLDPHERELHALGLLDALAAVGELDRARQALADVPLLAEGSTHALVLPAYEAQLLLLEGKPREALALVADAVTDRRLERGRHVVRAHAHAALGNVERCNESLGWLQAEFGADGLRRVLTPEGPASELARGWLGQRKGPYRG